MKQLIKNIENSDVLDQIDYREFFITEVNTSDIEDKELRVAVQSFKMADSIIKGHLKKLAKGK